MRLFRLVRLVALFATAIRRRLDWGCLALEPPQVQRTRVNRTVSTAFIELPGFQALMVSAFIAILPCIGFAQASPDRMALVIGNGAYSESPLSFSGNDAEAMSLALQKTGFAVTIGRDLDSADMRRAIEDFGNKSAGAKVVLFYFAGHGVQNSRAKNFLIPVDISPNAADSLIQQGIDVESEILRRLTSNMESRTLVVILDSCRLPAQSRPTSADIPLTSTTVGGLARMSIPSGTFVAYATEPGHRAFEETQAAPDHGTFTAELLKNIGAPGITIEQVFKRTRSGVETATRGRQSPREESALRADQEFRFNDPASSLRSAAIVTLKPSKRVATAQSSQPKGTGNQLAPLVQSIRATPREQRVRALGRLLENRAFVLSSRDIAEITRSYWVAGRPKVLKMLEPLAPRTLTEEQFMDFAYLLDRRDLLELATEYQFKKRLTGPFNTSNVLARSLETGRTLGACKVVEAPASNAAGLTSPGRMDAKRLLAELGSDPVTLRRALHEILQQNEVALSFGDAMTVMKAFPPAARAGSLDEILQLFPDRLVPDQVSTIVEALQAPSEPVALNSAPNTESFAQLVWRVDGQSSAQLRHQVGLAFFPNSAWGDHYGPALNKYCPELQSPIEHVIGLHLNQREYSQHLRAYWGAFGTAERLQFAMSRDKAEQDLALRHAAAADPRVTFGIVDLAPYVTAHGIIDRNLIVTILYLNRLGSLRRPITKQEADLIRTWFSPQEATQLFKQIGTGE